MVRVRMLVRCLNLPSKCREVDEDLCDRAWRLV